MGVRTSGFGAPAYTGMSSRPAHSRARRALREVLSRRTLPATVVSARIFSSSGEAMANSKATTSSAPGSVSMIRSIFSAPWALAAVRKDKSSTRRKRCRRVWVPRCMTHSLSLGILERYAGDQRDIAVRLALTGAHHRPRLAAELLELFMAEQAALAE